VAVSEQQHEVRQANPPPPDPDAAGAIWPARRRRVARRKVELEEPIKALGSYKVPITVWGDIHATVKVMVVPAADGEEGAVEAFEAEPVDDDLV